MRPASPTTRPCYWPATPPNATTSPPASLASTPNPRSGPAPDSSDGQSEAWALRCVQGPLAESSRPHNDGTRPGPFNRVRANMGLVSALLADRQSIGDTTETNAITCSSARPSCTGEHWPQRPESVIPRNRARSRVTLGNRRPVGAALVADMGGFDCICAYRLSDAERSDLQLAVGGSGHARSSTGARHPHLRRVAMRP